ncbi:biotin-requiring enzyme [Nitzschia inconspicua]|uniref:Biotin-requiring enzyme n=1 Tax=Nitzschia inconspicua TaxID=303405 RepID=A0A9K3PBT2_9STRA|nr:biotin-requiring enzyme [Nitzschia inconspicua]
MELYHPFEADVKRSKESQATEKGATGTSLKGGDPAAYTVPKVIKVPDMSKEDDKNNVLEKWYKQPGDVIKRNDVLCDITTPDFTFGMVTEDEDDAVMGDYYVSFFA